ncbi:MAG: Gfo/Idh/MocA family oxidoreductase [Planctomycetes bacterium]|nr:Gfo/Idh/MocA family oxidoreductase [Planctomycetota bacterium]
MTTRRTFLTSTAAGAAALGLAAPAVAAADKLTVALIGCGGMGRGHLNLLVKHPQLSIAYVCDADDKRLADAAKIATDAGHAVKAEKDMRKVLDDKAVHAVWMATPDHWHAPGAILAADHGKHVYVEKPCSHNVREGRLMIDAAARNKVHIQVGTQARSTKTVAEAMKRIHDGAIGEVLAGKAWNSQLRRNLGKVKPSDPPAHIDYALWQGPVPEAPFYTNRVHGSWRFFLDYGAGDMGNDGVHNVDVGVWGMRLDALPNRVAALGGKSFFDDDQEWPDTQYVVCEYDPGNGGKKPRQFVYEQRIWSPYVQEGYENGNAFYGTKGMLIIGHTIGWKMYGEKNKPLEEMTGRIDLPAHHQNFIDACLKGGKLAAPVDVGHISAGICHLANISGRLRKTLEFDPVKEQITNGADANAMLRRKYRADHWAVPKGV